MVLIECKEMKIWLQVVQAMPLPVPVQVRSKNDGSGVAASVSGVRRRSGSQGLRSIARREEATLRPRRPSGLAPQTRLRGSHALEETVVRPLRVLPLLLQRSVFPSFLFSGITRRPVCFLAETPFCSLS